MFFIKEYVPASTVWVGAQDCEDIGYIAGLVRGYNIEVVNSVGTTSWLSCEYIHGSVETEFGDEFHNFYYYQHGWQPTGRICFRGYGIERYDESEHETYVEKIDMTGEKVWQK